MSNMSAEERAQGFAEWYMNGICGSSFGDRAHREVFSWPFAERLAEQIRQAEDAAYRRGLEHAAQKAETFFDWCKPIGEHRNMALAQEFGKECAGAIRNLAKEST